MSAGRKPTTKTVAPAVDPSLDQEKIEGAMVAMRSDAQQELLDLTDLAGAIHAHHALSIVKSFASAAQVQLFIRVRNSKQINRLPIRMPDGEVKTFDSIKDACQQLFGRTYQSMLDAEARYEVVGQEAYEAAARLRLNDRALRAARALPPGDLEQVRAAIASGAAKSEVMAVIEDLAEKAGTAEKAVEDLKGEVQAREELITAKNKRIDTLERDKKRIAKLPPDEQLKLVMAELTECLHDALGCIRGQFRQGLIALKNHGDDDHSVVMGGMVGQIQAELNALREEFRLPDMSAAADRELASEVAQWAKG